jgi:hypothetical protein
VCVSWWVGWGDLARHRRGAVLCINSKSYLLTAHRTPSVTDSNVHARYERKLALRASYMLPLVRVEEDGGGGGGGATHF